MFWWMQWSLNAHCVSYGRGMVISWIVGFFLAIYKDARHGRWYDHAQKRNLDPGTYE